MFGAGLAGEGLAVGGAVAGIGLMGMGANAIYHQVGEIVPNARKKLERERG